MNLPRTALLMVLMLVVGPLRAETAYVTDKLRLGVYLTRDTSGQAFASLKSGDAVEVLERDGQLTFVKMEDARTGWMRGAFLQSEAPALRRIAGIEAENERLTSEVEALRASNSGQEVARLQAAVDAAVARADAAADEQSRLQSENRGLREQLLALNGAVPLRWLAAGVGGALLLGAFLASRWIDYRSRRRHGGFRIY